MYDHSQILTLSRLSFDLSSLISSLKCSMSTHLKITNLFSSDRSSPTSNPYSRIAMVLILIRSTHLSSHTRYNLCSSISTASPISSDEMMVSHERCTTPSRYHGSFFSSSWTTTSRVSETQLSSMVEGMSRSSMRRIAGRDGHSVTRGFFLGTISRIL